MKYNESIATLHGGRIEIADTPKGGNSSWGIKEKYDQSSVRLAWYNDGGRFDPISSAELPIWGLKELMIAAADRNMIDASDIAKIMTSLSISLTRQFEK
jgi:hypothetical protein